jgi:hypothetical protein
MHDAQFPGFSGVFYATAVCFALVFCLSAEPSLADDSDLIGQERTWRTPDQLTAVELKRVDISAPKSTASALQLPEGEWPFKAPYSAQEIGYRLMDFTHAPRWSHVVADAYGVLTKSGYLSQGVTVGMVQQVYDPGAQGQIDSKPGEIHQRQIFFYTYPPKDKGLQSMWSMRRTGPENHTKLDSFIYSPELRRVRRQPSPRRETPFTNMVQSYDDISGREAWEFNWRILGADTLYETVRFPVTRKQITLSRSDGSFYDVPTTEFKMMSERYPFYRVDGGIDCFVVVSEPKRDWLPDYKVSKLIYWVDQFYLYPLRIEQYDENGDLKTVQVRFGQQDNKNLSEGYGYTNIISVYYDVQRDLISYSVHDGLMLHTWTEEEIEMFTPDFLRRRWLKYPRQSQSLVLNPEQFYLRPKLLKDRFPMERSIDVAPDVLVRIEAQERNGYLTFSEIE